MIPTTDSVILSTHPRKRKLLLSHGYAFVPVENSNRP